jgi:hypothetical protein
VAAARPRSNEDDEADRAGDPDPDGGDNASDTVRATVGEPPGSTSNTTDTTKTTEDDRSMLSSRFG